jgi:decaprenylphospho-beta-D-ribofuranose 2-oxidase
MHHKKRLVSNWGNFPKTTGMIVAPQHADAAVELVRSQVPLIARGNGRCYGDAALGDTMLSTLGLNRCIGFDEQNGIVECEAGMLLADILPVIIPRGWFFAVTPGTKLITVGGAIASDVHGKNHVTAGCFSQFLLSFQLLRSDGQVIQCSPSVHPELFWQTCGGMGWTGIILSARFQLQRIASVKMIQETRYANNLKEMLELLLKNTTYPYAAAWIDGNATKQNLGSGILFWAKHAEAQGSLLVRVRAKFNIPFFVPNGLLNRLTIRCHDWFFRRSNPEGIRTVSLEDYFYPLDRIQHWNRLYGSRGFIQYQFCVVEDVAEVAIRNVLNVVRNSKHRSFLSVLKCHGERPAAAVHSFPEKGFSLALDFPRNAGIMDLVTALDQIILKYNGKIYLAKDACADARLSRINPFAFGEEQFMSVMRKRLREGGRI